MDTIKLGQKVKNKVSGFVGIAVAKCEYLNGCIQFHVSPPVDEKGNERKDQWIDEGQLEIMDNGILPKPKREISSILPTRTKVRSGGGQRSHPC